MPSLRVLLGMSLTTAAIAFVCPLPYRGLPQLGTALTVGFLVSAAWILQVLYAWFKIGRRASWLLLGLPLSFLWPLVSLWVYLACRLGHDCI